jgi:hypothetical protein
MEQINAQVSAISNKLGDDFVTFVVKPLPSRSYSVLATNQDRFVIKYKFSSKTEHDDTGPGKVT